MNAWAACPLAASAEPALKPNQPNHRMPVPIMTSGIECGGSPSLRPALALAEHEHGGEGGDAGVDVDGRAAGEVERATLAEPAAEHPLEDRARRRGTSHSGTKIAHAENFMRSATAPEISAGVIAANIPRKATMASAPAVTGDRDVLQEEGVEACR